MAQITSEMEQEAILGKGLQSLLLNANLWTPEERGRILKLLEYLILPRYAPIEEDWAKKKSVLEP